jgi:hypothetical protein
MATAIAASYKYEHSLAHIQGGEVTEITKNTSAITNWLIIIL